VSRVPPLEIAAEQCTELERRLSWAASSRTSDGVRAFAAATRGSSSPASAPDRAWDCDEVCTVEAMPAPS
jgi:hypothetical protein